MIRWMFHRDRYDRYSPTMVRIIRENPERRDYGISIALAIKFFFSFFLFLFIPSATE